jgi:hypothetical protein
MNPDYANWFIIQESQFADHQQTWRKNESTNKKFLFLAELYKRIMV